MGNLRLYGSTSGYTELAPPAVAPDGVLSLPSGTGTLLTAEGGKVLQIVRATDSTGRSTTSTSYVDAGKSVTITPQKNTSTILLISTQFCQSASSNEYIYLRITDNSNNALSGAEEVGLGGSSGGIQSYMTVIGYASPATTSATTYKLRFKSNTGGLAQIYNASSVGQLFAIEVSA
jgi:hypothetical protein